MFVFAYEFIHSFSHLVGWLVQLARIIYPLACVFALGSVKQTQPSATRTLACRILYMPSCLCVCVSVPRPCPRQCQRARCPNWGGGTMAGRFCLASGRYGEKPLQSKLLLNRSKTRPSVHQRLIVRRAYKLDKHCSKTNTTSYWLPYWCTPTHPSSVHFYYFSPFCKSCYFLSSFCTGTSQPKRKGTDWTEVHRLIVATQCARVCREHIVLSIECEGGGRV